MRDRQQRLAGDPVADEERRAAVSGNVTQDGRQHERERPFSCERGQRATVGDVALLADGQLGGPFGKGLILRLQRDLRDAQGLRARPHLLLEVLARSAQRSGHAVEGRGELSKLVGGACIDIDGEVSGTDGARRRGQRLYGAGDPPREKEASERREDEHDAVHGDRFADEPVDRRQYRALRGEVEQRPGDRRQPSNDAEGHQPVLGRGSLEFVRHRTAQHVRELLRHRHRRLEQLPGVFAEAALGREHRDGGGVQWPRGMEHLLSLGAVRDAHPELIVDHRIAARTRAPVSLCDEVPEFLAARHDQ